MIKVDGPIPFPAAATMSISLSDEHEMQVQGYLRFAKLKRDQHVREALSVITEFRSDRLAPGVRRPGDGSPWLGPFRSCQVTCRIPAMRMSTPTPRAAPQEMYNYRDLSALLDDMSDSMRHLVDRVGGTWHPLVACVCNGLF